MILYGNFPSIKNKEVWGEKILCRCPRPASYPSLQSYPLLDFTPVELHFCLPRDISLLMFPLVYLTGAFFCLQVPPPRFSLNPQHSPGLISNIHHFLTLCAALSLSLVPLLWTRRSPCTHCQYNIYPSHPEFQLVLHCL